MPLETRSHPVSRQPSIPDKTLKNQQSLRPTLYEETGDFALLLHHTAPKSYPEEVHETVQVCIPYEGARYDVFRSSQLGARLTHRLCTNDILVIPNGQPHAVNWLRSADIFSLHLSSGFLEQVLDAPVPQLPDALILHDQLIFETAIELRHAATLGRASPMLLGSCATLIAHHIATKISDLAGEARGTVCPLALRERSRLAEYIDSHLDRSIKISELSAIMGLSQWHFLRRFQVTEGITPHQFIIRRRMERARELLLHTAHPVSQIAMDMGLSQSHFSRAFLRVNRLSPQAFRQKHKDLRSKSQD